jgi:carbon-monoxide dehydrogenase medium subunit
MLSQYKGEAQVIAGGTDLLVRMKSKVYTPQHLIGLKSIADLDYIRYDESQGLSIGALASISSIASSPLIKERCSFLGAATRMMATPQVRNLGTIGGNLCNAAPSADTAPPLIAARATAKILGAMAEREVSLEQFFTGPGETVLEIGELLAGIEVPNPPAYTGRAYLKLFPRSGVDIAAVGVAVSITLDAQLKVCREAIIALGAVAPTPVRAKKAEEVLRGKELAEGLIDEAAEVAGGEAKPISDCRSSADYRREMVKVLTRRAVTQAWEQAKTA